MNFIDVIDASLILSIAGGALTVRSVIENAVRKHKSPILGYAALLLLLGESMTIKDYIKDCISSENDLEEEEDEDIDS